MEILNTCRDYNILKENLNNDELEYIDNVLVDFRQYSTINDDGEKDIIGEYCDKYGNYNIICWEQSVLSTNEFIEYIKETREN